MQALSIENESGYQPLLHQVKIAVSAGFGFAARIAYCQMIIARLEKQRCPRLQEQVFLDLWSVLKLLFDLSDADQRLMAKRHKVPLADLRSKDVTSQRELSEGHRRLLTESARLIMGHLDRLSQAGI